MSTFSTLRRVATAASVVLAALLPAAVPATAAPGRAVSRAVGQVVTPPLPVGGFPAQVRRACGTWRGLHWPTADRPTDYQAGGGLVIRGSNVYGNRSGDLPAGGHYREYDVNPRTPGRHRDAERLVRDQTAHTVWYTGDHYANFRQISTGCP
jgi:ribonuclease T1